MSAKLLVIGCPRSGTLYTAEFLRALGVRVKHESLGRDGSVGWLYAVQPPGESEDYGRVWHVVRDPLRTISSLALFTRTLWRVIGHWVKLPRHPLRRRMAFWIEWNRLAERRADWRFRVEDLRAGRRAFAEALARLGIPKATPAPAVARDTNTRPHPVVTWADLDAASPALARQVRDLAIEYGYAGEKAEVQG